MEMPACSVLLPCQVPAVLDFLPAAASLPQSTRNTSQAPQKLPHLSETQPIYINSMTMSGKSGCVQPRHNFQARRRVCSETSDIF